MNNQPILPEDTLRMYSTSDLIELVAVVSKILAERVKE